MTMEGATDMAVFRTYMDKALVPILVLGNIVVKDNFGSHKVRGIREAIEAAAATLL